MLSPTTPLFHLWPKLEICKVSISPRACFQGHQPQTQHSRNEGGPCLSTPPQGLTEIKTICGGATGTSDPQANLAGIL